MKGWTYPIRGISYSSSYFQLLEQLWYCWSPGWVRMIVTLPHSKTELSLEAYSSSVASTASPSHSNPTGGVGVSKLFPRTMWSRVGKEGWKGGIERDIILIAKTSNAMSFERGTRSFVPDALVSPSAHWFPSDGCRIISSFQISRIQNLHWTW